jgi:glucosyl-dolichyl phosphate glucuronosyltransferase
MTSIPPAVDLTLLVCTFNRRADLREMLETALAQENDGTFTYDVVVVDNNSTDDTPQVVQEFVSRGHANLRYLVESRQGKSYALNTGLAALSAPLYTIADDDFVLPPNWVKTIIETFRANPDVSFVGGKVLPLWQGAVPSWLTRQHWSAVALADYGDAPFYANQQRRLCLLACSFRAADVQAVGGYHPSLGVSKDSIGGVEDLEILERLWNAGRQGRYVPLLWFSHKVPTSRMTKTYHRRWHTGHGRFYAVLRDPTIEKSSARLFDVPAHLYRQTAVAAYDWLRHTLRGNESDAFASEARIRFFFGFFEQRRRDSGRRILPELAGFVRALIGNKLRGFAICI